VLFAVCVNGPLWTDFQINRMEWNNRIIIKVVFLIIIVSFKSLANVFVM